jgi:hypothetical protein
MKLSLFGPLKLCLKAFSHHHLCERARHHDALLGSRRPESCGIGAALSVNAEKQVNKLLNTKDLFFARNVPRLRPTSTTAHAHTIAMHGLLLSLSHFLGIMSFSLYIFFFT